MASITLTFSDAVATRVLTALAAHYGYPPTVEDPPASGTFIPNPETRAAFVKRMIALELKRKVVAYEALAAARTAEDAAGAAADSEISVT